MTVIDSTPVKSPPPVDVCVSAGSVHPRPDGQDRYTISEVAAHTGLKAHTVRWYEEIGLMPPVARSQHGQRLFSNRDLDWLGFVTKLRLTGMPVADMVDFAELVRQGEASYDERRQILQRTRGEVVARMAELQDTLDVLDAKIDFYAGAHRAPEKA
ncbi:MerR family transcriptional regulator [Streptomyces odontomachi]|uniref:MerR family transcriptional regulator n=1 Tax=Streptomyces odontomachi TaxID=2944940 RepID=UPI00210D95F0|nr:MerR family transcriptional regulator [Streptomyces sp. ODS25]